MGSVTFAILENKKRQKNIYFQYGFGTKNDENREMQKGNEINGLVRGR